MSGLIVLRPDGTEAGGLAAPLDHRALLNLAHGIGPKDLLVTMLEGDHWRLAVVWGSKPEPERVEILEQYADRIEYGSQAKAGEVLRELAVLALLDEGWQVRPE